MKSFLFVLVATLFSNILSSQDCGKLTSIISEHKSSAYLSDAKKGATKILYKQALKQILGKANIYVKVFVSVFEIGKNRGDIVAGYKKEYVKLQGICNKSKIDENALKKSIKSLEELSEIIVLERHFGNEEQCYSALKSLTKELSSLSVNYCKAK